jgi:hypothetical protein
MKKSYSILLSLVSGFCFQVAQAQETQDSARYYRRDSLADIPRNEYPPSYYYEYWNQYPYVYLNYYYYPPNVYYPPYAAYHNRYPEHRSYYGPRRSHGPAHISHGPRPVPVGHYNASRRGGFGNSGHARGAAS